MANDKELDRTGFFGEIRRFARTSGAVGGIAARLAGERLGFHTNKANHAEELKTILGGLKGPLMKVAQLLSTIPDALPEEYARELAQLQANAPSMGWGFVRRRMNNELGLGWEKKFKSFEPEAAAAASLGQVHHAFLPNGEEVACKLQYPDMKATVDADLRQLKLAMALYHRLDNAIKQEEVYKELAERLKEELDYLREAANMRLYTLMLKGQSEIGVPEPVESLCTPRLLTMSWVQGRPLQEVIDSNPTQEQRNAIARALFLAWYIPFYRYGVIHGDPHMGNFLIRDDYGLNLLDFGSIRIFPPSFVKGVIDLHKAIATDDEDLAYAAYQAWGFENLSRETMRVLNEWAKFIYEPLLQDRVRKIQDNADPTFGRSIAEKVHIGLQKTGGVKPPREFVLLDRSAIGLGSIFTRLKAELNWYELFQEVMADFDTEALVTRQKEAMAAARVPPPL